MSVPFELPSFEFTEEQQAQAAQSAQESTAAAQHVAPTLEEPAPCPFAMIQAAIDHGVLTDVPEPTGNFKASTSAHAASSDATPPPLTVGRNSESGQSLLARMASWEKRQQAKQEPSAIEKLRLACPVSGVSMPLTSSEPAKQDDDAASHKSGRSGRSGSRKSGSHRSGSRKSGSRGKSKASSSNASSRRRGRKIPTFSEWEADNYIPHIKSSWQNLVDNSTPERLSTWFMDKMLELDPSLQPLVNALTQPVMAGHFWKALVFISESVDEPSTLPEKMRDLSARHIENNVTQAQIKIFGEALTAMLETFREYHSTPRTPCLSGSQSGPGSE